MAFAAISLVSTGLRGQAQTVPTASPYPVVVVLSPHSPKYSIGMPIMFDLTLTNAGSQTITGTMHRTHLDVLTSSVPGSELICPMAPDDDSPSGHESTSNARRAPAAVFPNPNYAIYRGPNVQSLLFSLAPNATLTIPNVSDLTCFYQISMSGTVTVQGDVELYIRGITPLPGPPTSYTTNVVPITISGTPLQGAR